MVGAIDGFTQKERAFSQTYTTPFCPTANWIVLAISRVHLSPLVIIPGVIPHWEGSHRYMEVHSLVLEISSLIHMITRRNHNRYCFHLPDEEFEM